MWEIIEVFIMLSFVTSPMWVSMALERWINTPERTPTALWTRLWQSRWFVGGDNHLRSLEVREAGASKLLYEVAPELAVELGYEPPDLEQQLDSLEVTAKQREEARRIGGTGEFTMNTHQTRRWAKCHQCGEEAVSHPPEGCRDGGCPRFPVFEVPMAKGFEHARKPLHRLNRTKPKGRCTEIHGDYLRYGGTYFALGSICPDAEKAWWNHDKHIWITDTGKEITPEMVQDLATRN